MTIKQFASLCGCNTQTLRYYDKIDLLKPVRVDQWSGYRYYTKSQAVDFVKIKNFQSADFSIQEIKRMLTMTDREVYDAFEGKIAEQTQRLERIKEIQRSYLIEKNNMEKLIQNLADYLLHAVSDFELLREFGMSPEDGPAVVDNLRAFIERRTRKHLPAEPDVEMRINDHIIRGVNQVADAFAALKENQNYEETVLLSDSAVGVDEGINEENSEVCWQSCGWDHVYEFLPDVPQLENGYEYIFFFRVPKDKIGDGLEFPMFMIAAMLPHVEDEEIILGCEVKHCEDGKNYFELRRKQLL